MVEFEIDGFTIDVPLKAQMTIQEFLAVADKLEAMANRTHRAERHIEAAVAAAPSVFRRPVEEDFRFEDELNPQHMKAHIERHMEHLRAHEQRLQAQEEHTRKILEYLQSLDRFIRR
jgi:ADP-ribosylglycohydrolase